MTAAQYLIGQAAGQRHVAADAAARVKDVLAAEVDDGGGGLHDVSTVALRLHTKGHDGLLSLIIGRSCMIYGAV